MANIFPPALAAAFFSPPGSRPSFLFPGGANSVTCPPLAISPRTTPSSIRVATTSMHDPGTSDPLGLESSRPPSVITQPSSATATYAPRGTGLAPDEPVRAFSRLIQPLACSTPALPSRSSRGASGTMTRARTLSPLTCVWTTSTHRPRSSFPRTAESRSGVSRRGSPPPKLIRYTPIGTGSVQGPASSSVAVKTLPLLPAALSSSSSPFSASFSSSSFAHWMLIHPSYLAVRSRGGRPSVDDFLSVLRDAVRRRSRDVLLLMLPFFLSDADDAGTSSSSSRSQHILPRTLSPWTCVSSIST
mmetsp:Transcript_22792/g.48973  ORF Transcript_22792/g.48973 Transcript_22792/m.48973 type:complete len:302 (-) Transcript_22792:161-1066(-)